MDRQKLLETYSYFVKNWPAEKIDDLLDFLTCEYTDYTLSKMFQSFHKSKSIKTRLKIVDMFKKHMTRLNEIDNDTTFLETICDKRGLD